MQESSSSSPYITKLCNTVEVVARQLCVVSNQTNKCNNNTKSSKASMRGLDRMDENILANSLESVRAELAAIDAESFLTLERVLEGAIVQPGVRVQPIKDEIYPSLPRNQSTCVRYIHIDEIPELYSIGIFLFPPFATIPLHDHPNMAVLSRVLYGDVSVKSYNILPETSSGYHDTKSIRKGSGSTVEMEYLNHNPNGKRWYSNILPAVKEIFTSHSVKGKNESDTLSTSSGNKSDRSQQSIPTPLRAIENSTYRLVAPDVSALFPHSGNVHEFRAGEYGAAILDCILPPYDTDHDRDCTFYVEEETPLSFSSSSDIDKRKPCWLIPIPSPTDFHCIPGTYRLLGASTDSDTEME